MAARRVDAALLTDDKGMLSGIVTAEVRIGRSRKRLLWTTCCTFSETIGRGKQNRNFRQIILGGCEFVIFQPFRRAAKTESVTSGQPRSSTYDFF
jgi:hypothetical protein